MTIKQTPWFKQLENDDDEKFKLVTWCRRAGKTTYIAQAALKDLIDGKNVLIISPNLNMCSLMQYKMYDFLKENWLLKDKIKFDNLRREMFTNKNIIWHTVPSSQSISRIIDKIYIEEGSLISYDDFAKLGKLFWQDIPTEIFFTPIVYKKSNRPFVKLLWDESDKFEHYHLDYKWLDCAREIKKSKAHYNREQWRTEFLAEWVETPD